MAQSSSVAQLTDRVVAPTVGKVAFNDPARVTSASVYSAKRNGIYRNAIAIWTLLVQTQTAGTEHDGDRQNHRSHTISL
jgi:hypothetical protein